MHALRRLAFVCCVGVPAVFAFSGVAVADGYDYGAPPAPADERTFTYSLNIGGASDYVFRGVSQSSNDPVPQGGADAAYGILYGGVWASGIDFDNAPPANAEVDWYGGIKPTWSSPFGIVNFDFGGIYYSYPAADPFPGADLNYFELKAGYSWSSLHPSLVTGSTVFYSPDYFAETGPVWTIESFAGWMLPKAGFLSPAINGLVGWQKGDAAEGYWVNVNMTDDEYYYWNAGLVLGVGNISFDFRYWDTNIGGDAANVCASPGLCSDRFVVSVKVVVP